MSLNASKWQSEAFLKSNPLGPTRALHDPRRAPLTLSLAIHELPDEIHPGPPLSPADLHGRTRVRTVAQMLGAYTHPLIAPRVKKSLTTLGGFDDWKWRARQFQWLGVRLAAVERRLASEPSTETEMLLADAGCFSAANVEACAAAKTSFWRLHPTPPAG